MINYLEIEKNCNFRCVFCVKGEGTSPQHRFGMWTSRKTDHVTLSEIASKNIHDSRIVLSGGEPTCNPELYDILVHLKEPARNNRVTLQTNATRFCDADYAKKVTPLINGMQIPCYGGTKELFEASCGVDGAWDEWNRALDNLQRYGRFNAPISAIVVLTKINVDGLDDIINLVNSRDLFYNISFKALHYMSYVMESKDLVAITETEALTKLSSKLHLVKKLYDVDDFHPCILDTLGLTFESMGYCSLPEDLYTKLDVCNGCSHLDCKGVEKNYLKVFGDGDYTHWESACSII